MNMRISILIVLGLLSFNLRAEDYWQQQARRVMTNSIYRAPHALAVASAGTAAFLDFSPT
jgi:hypothetical protein